MSKVLKILSDKARSLSSSSFAYAFVKYAAEEDERAHAAELAAKDARIAELDGQLAELEQLIVKERLDHAELVKRKELPPLPPLITCWVNGIRNIPVRTPAEDEAIAFVDTHYPAPVPQWEKNAQMIENEARQLRARIKTYGASCKDDDLLAALDEAAARIREAHRESK